MALLLAGCSFTTKQSSLDPKGPVARDQLQLFYVTVWVSLFIFVTVGGTMVVVVIKYRERPEDVGKPLPQQAHGNPLVEISLIGASIALLVIVAIPTLKSIWFDYDLPTDQTYYKPSLLGQWYPNPPEKSADEPLEVTVYGYQWWWAFDYKQFGVTSANEFVIPAGKVVKIDLRSRDVIHSFWLPKLAGKIDLMPGRANWLWLMADADQPGLYYGQCAQFCGEAHAYMLFRCQVVSDKEFEEWIAKSKAPVPPPTGGTWDTFLKQANTNPASLTTDPEKGAALFFGRANCVQCHTINGSPAQGLIGPDLSRIGSRTSVAAGILDNLGDDGQIDPPLQLKNLHDWISHSQDIKPGNHMYYLPTGMKKIEADNETAGTPLTDENFTDIAAFLQTLK
jgi:cytochrome c oxidase subunit 2